MFSKIHRFRSVLHATAHQRLSLKRFAAAVILLTGSSPPLMGAPWNGSVIHSFTGLGGGYSPIFGTLVQDASGNLYGTTSDVPSEIRSEQGTVFRLTPDSKSGKKWKFKNIYHFLGRRRTDPGYPIGGLTMDAQGNLYGTTTVGLVFELSPPSNGSDDWSYQTIANLESQQNSALVGSLLLSSSGALFGASEQSAAYANGSIFELVPPNGGSGPWTYNLIYAFQGSPDGSHPSAGLMADAQGNLYGTTSNGGNAGDVGTVFELTPPAPGGSAWTETVLYSFAGGATDGSLPLCSLLMDPSGALYGTTYEGGPSNNGTVFKLSPPSSAGSSWSESLIHIFSDLQNWGPKGGLIADSRGSLYGSTVSGPNTAGTVFKLSLSAGSKAKWSLKTLWDFPSITDGGEPQGNLLMTTSGDLYGTAEYGGSNSCQTCGTVFRVAR